MLEPVAPISSWHQVILALSVLTSLVGIFALIPLTIRQYMLSVVVLPQWLTMDFIVSVCF